MAEKLEAGQRWQHVKRGTTYDVLGVAELQNANTKGLREGASLAVYRGEDGKLWARAADEFTDGRFVLTATPDRSDDALAEERWQPINTFPADPKWQMATMVLCAHDEKQWVRFGRYYGEMRRWYYSGTNERSQWAEQPGDAPTHWMPFPKAPRAALKGDGL